VPEQLALLGREEVRCDAGFSRVRRIELARGAWVEYSQGWLSGHAELFETLVRDTNWQTSEQHIYDRTVATPRLVASLSDLPLPGPLERMRDVLGARYASDFSRVSLALYRDGRDSVAFHGDRIARELPDALVATVSLGAPRRFWLRPRPSASGDGKVAPIAFKLGWGDLLVMGGSCQRTWLHGIPKVSHAEPRIALMFRPVWGESDDY
jgi:alkylated DNA repair dioxygenase AlkB